MDSNLVHVLLAEDDEDDRFLFEQILTTSSISVFLTTVEDGEKLLNLLETISAPPPPDVIFIDINMPLKNGIECLAQIRGNKKFDKVPVFMFSTSVYKHDVDLAYQLGANLYIPKQLFFDGQKQIIEQLFSVHWKDYLTKIPKDSFVLQKDTKKESNPS